MAGGKIIRVEIEDLAFDGKSVGHLDGKVIFCNGGLPGEEVLAEVVRNKPRYNTAVVREITRKSDARIPAVCSHFDGCGGCTWQDLRYEDQLKYKHRQVVACMERIAGLKEVTVAEVIGAPDPFFYRNKMEFSFHVEDDGGFALGLHRQGRFDEIFDLSACHLQSESSNRLVARVREYVSQHNIPVYDVKNHTGYMRFLVVREGKRTDQTLVNVVTNYGEMPDAEGLVAALREAESNIASVVHNQNGLRSNVATGEVETILYGPGWIEEEIAGKRFRITANSFFQTNTLQAERLYQIGFDLLNPASDDSLLDLYCGTGTIGILAADRVADVTGIELVADAVRIARENARLNEVENITFFEGNVKDVLKSADLAGKKFSGIILDPPRAGLHPKVLKRTLEIGPPRILYISCNPATFSRDAATLAEAGYLLPEVIPVDMFPHTKHIELVGMFSRT